MASFTGLLQADGYAGFEGLYNPARTKPGPITEVACWAHCRRKFYDLWGATKSPIAKEPLDRIAAVYVIEDKARFAPAAERVEHRRETAPLLDKFFDWGKATVVKLSGKLELAKAFRYMIERREALTRFVTDGRLEVDNNVAENAMRCIALGRKNKLLLRSLLKSGRFGADGGESEMDTRSYAKWLGGIGLLDATQRARAFRELALAEASVPTENSCDAGDGAVASDGAAAVPGIVAPETLDTGPEDLLSKIGRERLASFGCPHCGGDAIHRWGQAGGRPRYRCTNCRKTFSPLTGTPLAGLHHRDRWHDQARALINGETVAKAAGRCKVAYTTGSGPFSTIL
jgi:predicted RNA-binding Zn-ribbon protein involved in translation (DUF1610 family)